MPSAPNDETIAWFRTKLPDLAVPEDLASRDSGELRTKLGRVLEAARGVRGEPRAGMIWGLAITSEAAPAVFSIVGPEVEQLARTWQEALARLGDPGRAFYAEVAEDQGIAVRGAVVRSGRRRYALEEKPADLGVLEEAVRAEHLELGREGRSVVSARIRTDFEADVDPQDVLEAVQSEHARTLRTLTLGLWSGEGDADYGNAICLLARKGDVLTSLESLFIGNFERKESEISWTTVGDLGPLWTKLPNLRSSPARWRHRAWQGAAREPRVACNRNGRAARKCGRFARQSTLALAAFPRGLAWSGGLWSSSISRGLGFHMLEDFPIRETRSRPSV